MKPTSWYHLSDTWNETILTVVPRKNRVDDEYDPRDTKAFIAVCPSVSQCAVALGSWYDYGRLRVYQAVSAENPTPADWVFDYRITDEHRFYRSTAFKKVGEIDLATLSVTKRTMSGSDDDALLLKNIEKTLAEFRSVIPKNSFS